MGQRPGGWSYRKDMAHSAVLPAYAADVVVPLSDSYVTPGASIALNGRPCVAVECKFTVAGAHNGNVIFGFQTSLDGTNWGATIVGEEFATITLVGAAGAGTSRKTAILDVRAAEYIRLSIVNNTATAVAGTANAQFSVAG